MKKFILCFSWSVILIGLSLNAQTVEWLEKMPQKKCAINDLKVDDDNNVLVAGSFMENNFFGSFLHKYSASGENIWMDKIPKCPFFQYNNITFDKEGKILIASDIGSPEYRIIKFKGQTILNPNGYSGCILKYNKNGSFDSLKIYRPKINDIGFSEKSNSLYIIGQDAFRASFGCTPLPGRGNYIAKVNIEGDCNWTKETPYVTAWAPTKVIITHKEEIFELDGNTYDGSWKIHKYREDGTRCWSYSASTAYDICTDKEGAVYFSTWTGIVKIDSTGKKVWSIPTNLKGGQSLFVKDSAIYSSCMAGMEIPGGKRVLNVAAYNLNGELKWSTTLPVVDWWERDNGLNFEKNIISADNLGNVYVATTATGFTHREAYLIKIRDTTFVAKEPAGETPTIIAENPNKQDLVIFPNPSAGVFRVQCAEESVQGIRVFNVMGELVYRAHLNEIPDQVRHDVFSLDLSDKPKGIYFVEVQGKLGKIVRKVVLQ